MTLWGDETDDAPELVDARARAELAAKWMIRHGPPSPAHYRAVMDALDATERSDAPELVDVTEAAAQRDVIVQAVAHDAGCCRGLPQPHRGAGSTDSTRLVTCTQTCLRSCRRPARGGSATRRRAAQRT